MARCIAHRLHIKEALAASHIRFGKRIERAREQPVAGKLLIRQRTPDDGRLDGQSKRDGCISHELLAVAPINADVTPGIAF